MKCNRIQSVLVLFVSIVLLTSSCQQKEKFDGYTITGTVKGLDNGLIKIVKTNITDRNAKPVILDSAQIENGQFQLKGKIQYADQVQMRIGNGITYFILENSPMEMSIEVAKGSRGEDAILLDIRGSDLNNKMRATDSITESIFNDKKYAIVDSLQGAMSKAYHSKNEALYQDAKKNFLQYEKLADERILRNRNYKIEYAKKNPTSVDGIYTLGFLFTEARMTREEMKAIYPIFEGDAKHTVMYQFYSETYKQIFESMAKGAKIPDFTLPSYTGGNITLSEVKGKYILVDFWASWCGPCRASFPHLKEIYAKYHKDGFEVVGVGTADAAPKWKKAIGKDQTPWIHVFDGDIESEKKQSGNIANLYGVPHLPTTFLIDENGIIVERQLREGNLDEMMKELFGY